MKRRYVSIILVGSVLSWLGDRAMAQATSQPDEVSYAAGLTLSPPPAPDSIAQRLADAKARPPGILTYGPVSFLDAGIDRMNAIFDPMGLKLGFSYTALYQAASGGPGIRDAAGQDVDLFGNWRLLGSKDGQNNG